MADCSKPGWLMKAMQVFSARNQILQVAALPWRMRKGRIEVCLVTSRGTGRWILPKGWPEKHLSHAEAAAIEAYEEAGLRGTADAQSCGHFNASKGLEPDLQLNVRQEVFLLPEPEQLDEFPERGERKVKWMTLEAAKEAADEPGLRALLSSLEQSGAFRKPAS